MGVQETGAAHNTKERHVCVSRVNPEPLTCVCVCVVCVCVWVRYEGYLVKESAVVQGECRRQELRTIQRSAMCVCVGLTLNP